MMDNTERLIIDNVDPDNLFILDQIIDSKSLRPVCTVYLKVPGGYISNYAGLPELRNLKEFEDLLETVRSSPHTVSEVSLCSIDETTVYFMYAGLAVDKPVPVINNLYLKFVWSKVEVPKGYDCIYSVSKTYRHKSRFKETKDVWVMFSMYSSAQTPFDVAVSFLLVSTTGHRYNYVGLVQARSGLNQYRFSLVGKMPDFMLFEGFVEAHIGIFQPESIAKTEKTTISTVRFDV